MAEAKAGRLAAVGAGAAGLIARPGERAFAVMAVLFFLALALVKMRAFLADGRFWAEEGRFFLADIAGRDFVAGLLYLYNGHVELWTNLLVWLATLVPLRWAPLVTTYGGFMLQMVPILWIVSRRTALGLSRPALLVVLLVAVGMPPSAEVWANTIDLHFHFALMAALLAVLPPATRGLRWATRALLLASGLSGIPANFLAPVFLWLALASGARERKVQAAILVATCAFQLWFLVSSDFALGQRSVMPRFDLALFATAAQSFYALFFGIEVGNAAGFVMRSLYLQPSVGVVFAAVVVCLTGLLALGWYTLRGVTLAGLASGDDRRVRIVACLAALVIGCTSTALGDKHVLISGWIGGRYFYAPNILWSLLLLGGGGWPPIRQLLLACLIVTSALGVPRYLEGPAWPGAHARALEAGGEVLRFEIWPDTWVMELPRGCCLPPPAEAALDPSGGGG